MIYTEFDPLEEVIVGDIYSPGDLDSFLPFDTSGFNLLLEETKHDLDHLADFLKQSNIKVHRPTVYKHSKHTFPEFDVNFPISPSVPRDAYIVRGKTICQTYTSLTDRYFDSTSYYDIFFNMFEEGYNWISQPAPMLKDLSEQEHWFYDEEIYNKKLSSKVLWHTATMLQAGDAVILNDRGPGSQAGLQWMKRNLPDTKFIVNDNKVFNRYGHIDHGFILIDDDTVIHAGIEWVPSVLHSKKLIDIKKFLPPIKLERLMNDYQQTGGRYDVKWVEKYLENWRGYNQEVCFDLNVLILDSKNILWGRHIPELFAYLKTFGIESHVCEMRHSLYWEGGIHCSTLDIKRKGEARTIVHKT